MRGRATAAHLPQQEPKTQGAKCHAAKVETPPAKPQAMPSKPAKPPSQASGEVEDTRKRPLSPVLHEEWVLEKGIKPSAQDTCFF